MLKYSCLFVFLFSFYSSFLYAQEGKQQTVTNELITFILPKGVLDFNHLPFPDNPQARNAYREKKLVYRMTVKDIHDLVNEMPWMVSESVRKTIKEKGEVKEADIIQLWQSGRKFVISNYFPMGDEESSYNYYLWNSKIIGECFFSSGTDGLLASGNYVYTLNLVLNNKIITIWINLAEGKDQIIPEQLPSIFHKRNGLWYWKSADSRKKLYEMMNSHDFKNLPSNLINLQNAWDLLKSSLQFVSNKQKSNTVVLGVMNDSRVRVRSEATLQSEVYCYLEKNDVVTILETTPAKERIGSLEAPWYKIKTSHGVVGWVFGAYIDLPTSNSEKTSTLESQH